MTLISESIALTVELNVGLRFRLTEEAGEG